MTDLKHDDTDLRARFGALASDLDLDGGDLTAVRARGDQRRRRQHVGTGLAGIIAVVAAVGIATQLMPNRQIDLIETPDVVESPTETPDSGLDDGPVQSAGWEYLHVRYDGRGVTRYDGRGAAPAVVVDEDIVNAIALPDRNGAVVVQLASGDPELGGGLWVETDDIFKELVPPAQGQTLLAYREADQTVWFVEWRDNPANEFGSEQVLYSVDLAPDHSVIEHGVIGDPDAALDALAFGRGVSEGQAAWIFGHMATGMYIGTIEDLIARPGGSGDATTGPFGMGYFAGLAFSPEGETIASVLANPDAEATTGAELVLWDLNGDERGRVALPTNRLEYNSAQITFGGGEARPVAVGDVTQAFVVDGTGPTYIPDPTTRVRPMDGAAGVSLFGGRGQVSGTPASDPAAALYEPVFYPEVGYAAYLDQQANGDRPGTFRSSALDLAVAFIDDVIAPTANGVAAHDRPETDSGEGYHVTLVDVWLGGVEPTSGADPTLVVSLRRIDGTMSYWVDSVRPYAESARPNEEPEFRLTSVGAARDGWDTTGRIDVNGLTSIGARVHVLGIANAGRYSDGVNGEIDADGNWAGTVYLEGRATEFVAVIALALDENGTVLSAYSVSIPPGPFAAG